ncbi:hypothetical protein BDK51DRAFT_47238 [Blyttiomyces helicus]|uniref:Uncharacterized protein n=1 Tax=Blyttiomyces helicus TaxID=388810 RepID=A0A4P9VX40_9FUNG|nr:hypothetical protein BDK51DRAFT_47238 [Blyttiomyces helicus]|eukprot:RKO84274.1 hypothetical protein BDK51DRAFT_47238 [Blyttiomyces helicus]
MEFHVHAIEKHLVLDLALDGHCLPPPSLQDVICLTSPAQAKISYFYYELLWALHKLAGTRLHNFDTAPDS